MINNIEPEYIGQLLLKRGFRDFFLYMFKIIEGRPFIIEPLHIKLFDYFQAIYDGEKTRCCINICPRSAKTTLSQYFLVYILTINPKSQIIYTSYSQSLLSEIANKVASILENPIYKALFPNKKIIEENDFLNPIDNFWRDYLYENTGRNTYSSKVIKTYMGGICLFSSCGSQITGYGAGIRNSKLFGGCLIIDDAQKPSDARSQVMRDKVIRYYEETLLSRLNNPNVPIINIQQRLHVQDLSGVLIEKYKFDLLRIPLLDENGVCQIPSQYTPERIEELKLNNYAFISQYQQQPIIDGGSVIKRDWFKYYPTHVKYNYKRILITADTAMKIKEHNDFSCFIVGGVTEDNHLHILDMAHGKWEAPDLKRIAVNLFNKWKYNEETGLACSGLYVEDKASGIGLIQELRREGIPVIGIPVDKDKLTRAENVISYIESGMVLLPNDERYSFNVALLNECEQFTRDDSHLHDDIVDTLVYNIQEALAKTKVSLLDFFIND